MICSDSEASDLDGQLGRAYARALADAPNTERLKAEQRAWLTKERNKCVDLACVRLAYGQRLSALAAPRKQDNTGESRSGIWKSSLGKFVRGELRTIDKGGTIEFQLQLWNPPPSEHEGYAEGEMAVVGALGTHSPADSEGKCRIEFAFSAAQVSVTEVGAETGEADCGFGQGVTADGLFKRVSRTVPKFVKY
jgi:hypothetical protein